jgi:hypothetical protein
VSSSLAWAEEETATGIDDDEVAEEGGAKSDGEDAVRRYESRNAVDAEDEGIEANVGGGAADEARRERDDDDADDESRPPPPPPRTSSASNMASSSRSVSGGETKTRRAMIDVDAGSATRTASAC